MRIAYLITRMDSLGGAQIHVRDMALAMQALGHDVYLLSGSEGPFTAKLADHGVQLRILPALGRAIHPWRDVLALVELLRVLRETRVDLLSLHSSKAGWLGRLAGFLLRLPTVFTAHGWAFSGGHAWCRQWLYLGLEKLASIVPAHLINVCEQDRHLAVRHGLAPSRRLTLIHNGVHDVPLQLRSRPATAPPRLVMVARFQEPKQHGDLLRALAGLSELTWTLEFIGDGPLQSQIARLVRDLGLEERIHFSGACTDVAQRLGQAQIFVLLSSREGFPRSILEAMRAGLPVIASDVGGVREAVTEGRSGFLIKAGDSAALTAGLRALLTDPEARARAGHAAREDFERNFYFERMFAETLKVYTELLGLDVNTCSARESQ